MPTLTIVIDVPGVDHTQVAADEVSDRFLRFEAFDELATETEWAKLASVEWVEPGGKPSMTVDEVRAAWRRFINQLAENVDAESTAARRLFELAGHETNARVREVLATAAREMQSSAASNARHLDDVRARAAR